MLSVRVVCYKLNLWEFYVVIIIILVNLLLGKNKGKPIFCQRFSIL